MTVSYGELDEDRWRAADTRCRGAAFIAIKNIKEKVDRRKICQQLNGLNSFRQFICFHFYRINTSVNSPVALTTLFYSRRMSIRTDSAL